MSEQRSGMLFALAAYGFWGFAPVYFKALAFAGPVEIIAHRVVWSVPLLALLIGVRRQFGALLALRADQVMWLALSGLLVALNWGVFIWALLNGRMLETSLGYYINPLVSVLLGVLFMGEWLRPGQLVAVALAATGVVNEIVSVGVVPWAGLTLAVSFGFYGLVRKRLGVDSAVGLGVEATLLLPLALAYLAYQLSAGQGALDRGVGGEIAWLAASGLVTTFPLVCFAAAALKLPLTTLGFVQYLAPTITFFLAVLVFGEAFRWEQSVTFGFIWLAVAIFSVEGVYFQRRLQRRLGRWA